MLPAALGRAGVRLELSIRRRAHGRIEVAVRTSPTRAGTVTVGLTFAGHRQETHALHLRHGVAALVTHVPRGATRLTLAVKGLGAQTTRHVSLN